MKYHWKSKERITVVPSLLYDKASTLKWSTVYIITAQLPKVWTEKAKSRFASAACRWKLPEGRLSCWPSSSLKPWCLVGCEKNINAAVLWC